MLEEARKRSWYIGYTNNLKRRLKEHNGHRGGETTRRAETWHCIYCEGYIDEKDAQGRERFLKSGSGRRFLKNNSQIICGAIDFLLWSLPQNKKTRRVMRAVGYFEMLFNTLFLLFERGRPLSSRIILSKRPIKNVVVPGCSGLKIVSLTIIGMGRAEEE